MNTENKICQNCHNSFTIEPDDFAFYERIQVPPPTFCPDCRFQRRLSFRNERSLYKRECALCGKSVLSVFGPHMPLIIYCYECWWSDKWDPLSYGRYYDFSKPFFMQYRELSEKVPVINKWGFDNVNCDYAAHTGYSKNVYLSSSIVRSEDTYFSYAVDKGKSIFDSFISGESESCYENINCQKTYHSAFLLDCRSCINSRFLYDCANCQDCFMSSNLRNKRFYIRNRPYSERAYREEMGKIVFDSYATKENLLREFQILHQRAFHKFADITACTDCTGNNIHNSKHVRHSFIVGNSENVRYCWRIPTNFKDASDISGALDSELVYEGVIAADHNYMVKFYMQVRSSKNVEYSMYCSFCNDCFGCIGLKKKQYCVFNKQYSEEEYKTLVAKIRAHMNETPYIDGGGKVYRYGEFFPPNLLSPFAYNETAAQEYFPLTRAEAESQGYVWKELDVGQHAITRRSEDLPDRIEGVDDSIFKEVISCSHTGTCNHQCTRAFKIIPEELKFYKRMHLPLPRLCPNCRHYERLAQRNPLRLWHRQCMKPGCQNEFETSYAPERPETVYCEQCYQTEVI